MKKIAMSKVTKESLVDVVLGQSKVVIPNSVTVLNYQTGEFDRGEQGVMYWANLEVCSTDELEKLTQVELQENVNVIKLKIADYKEESLDSLIGKVFATHDMEVLFLDKKTPRGVDINGMALKTSLKELQEIK